MEPGKTENVEKSDKTEKADRAAGESSRKNMRHATPPGEKQKFVKNDQYFTVCIYAFVLVVACVAAVKAIMDLEETKAFLGGLFRAVSPFLIALLIAYILNPFVKVVNRALKKVFPGLRAHEKASMVLAMVIVYVVALGMIIMLLIYILPEIVRNLGELIGSLSGGYQALLDWLDDLQRQFPMVDFSSIISMLQDTQSDLTNGLKDIAAEIVPVLYTASVSVVAWVGNFLIALIVSVYMLYGKASLKRLVKIVLYAFIPRRKISQVKETVVECNRIFSQYLISKMIDSFIIGILCAVLMSILRLPYVLLISVIVGVTNMIPYFGPFIGAIPGIIIILCIDPFKALIFAIMILCLQQFDGLILGPKLLGNSTGMKPIWIIFAITIGGKFFGVAGMFLGVPVMATLSYLAEQYIRHRLEAKNLSMDEL